MLAKSSYTKFTFRGQREPRFIMETASILVNNKKPIRKDRRRDPLQRLVNYYHLAKKQAWEIDDLPWNELPLVPKQDNERWHLLWASIVEQQLQADYFAVDAATQLLVSVEESEAIMYYTTMVQDEARHVEGWKRMVNGLSDVDANNPYFNEMVELWHHEDSLEGKIIGFQVCFEGVALHAFKDINQSAGESVLGYMAGKLVRDDAIHHNSGVAYAEHLLKDATPAFRKHLQRSMKRYGELYIESTLWRPPVRQWISRIAAKRDAETVLRNQTLMNSALHNIGIAPLFDI